MDLFGWIGRDAAPTPEPKRLDPLCKHLNARVHYHNRIGTGWCPDCDVEVHIAEVLNNWLDELAATKERYNER